MKVMVKLEQWVYENYEWKTKLDIPDISVITPQSHLVTFEIGSVSITIAKEDLRAALNAVDQQRR